MENGRKLAARGMALTLFGGQSLGILGDLRAVADADEGSDLGLAGSHPAAAVRADSFGNLLSERGQACL